PPLARDRPHVPRRLRARRHPRAPGRRPRRRQHRRAGGDQLPGAPPGGPPADAGRARRPGVLPGRAPARARLPVERDRARAQRLPLGMPVLHTLVLFASAVPMPRALGAVRRDDRRTLVRALALTVLLGTTFLAVQGLEWVRLVRHGLTLGSSMYGAAFYTLIG